MILNYLKKNAYIFLVIFLTGVFYIRITNFGFIWDDFNYIINNPILNDPSGLYKIWTSGTGPDFWPITYSLLWFVKFLFGNSEKALHLTNLFLYLFSVFLIFKVLEKLNYKFSLFVASLYAIHPVNAELVTWTFQIKSNLAIVFGLISIFYWVKYLSEEKLSYYLVCLVFLISSFLSKISLVLLPFVFVLIYLCKQDRVGYFKIFKKLSPIFFITFIIGLINVNWHDLTAYPTPESEIPLPESPLFRIALIGKSFWFYFFKILFPLEVSFTYPRFNFLTSDILTYMPTFSLCLCLLFSAYFFYKNKHKRLANSFIIAFLLLFPVLGLFEIYYMRFSFVADHWVGLAAVPLIIFFVELFMLAESFLKLRINEKTFKLFNSFICLAVISLLSVKSFNHAKYFQNEKILFEHTLKQNNKSFFVHNMLAKIYKNENDLDKAIFHYNLAISLHPTSLSFYNLAIIYDLTKNFELVESSYKAALNLNPYLPMNYLNLGTYYLRNNRPEDALKIYTDAIANNLGVAEIYYNLGIYYAKTDKVRALDYFTVALKLEPNNPIYIKKINELKN